MNASPPIKPGHVATECEITALAIKLCHYSSPANSLNSCCRSNKAYCIAEARRQLNQPPHLQE